LFSFLVFSSSSRPSFLRRLSSRSKPLPLLLLTPQQAALFLFFAGNVNVCPWFADFFLLFFSHPPFPPPRFGQFRRGVLPTALISKGYLLLASSFYQALSCHLYPCSPCCQTLDEVVAVSLSVFEGLLLAPLQSISR